MKITTPIVHGNSNVQLGVVACYYNPCNYLSKFINFLDFYFKLKETSDITIKIIEAYSSTSMYALKNTISESITSIKCESVYWQKEELINIGIRSCIEMGITKICWLDGDIEFQNSNWSEIILSQLEKHEVVQVFSESNTPIGYNNKKNIEMSFVKKLKSSNYHPFDRKGEIGYGYAYNVEILGEDLLYMNGVIGGGDFLNILPFISSLNSETIKKDRYFRDANENMISDYLHWYQTIKKDNINLGYCNNTIQVAFHGYRKNRNYVKREKILKELNFDPTIDYINEQGGLRSIQNENLRVYLKRYFRERNEDTFLENTKSKRYFNNIISRVLSKSKLKVNENKSTLQKIDILRSLNSIRQKTNNKINLFKKNRIAIWSKNKIQEIKTGQYKTIQDFVYDKSNRPQKYAIKNKNGERYAHTYLRYIIDNYDNLPNITLFLNDCIDHSCILNKKNIIENIPNNENQEYTSILNDGSRIQIDKLGHVVGLYKNTNIRKSNLTFSQWVVANINTKQSPLVYENYPIFYIGKMAIYRRGVEYYKNILNLISTTPSITEDELYLHRSWSLLFK